MHAFLLLRVHTPTPTQSTWSLAVLSLSRCLDKAALRKDCDPEPVVVPGRKGRLHLPVSRTEVEETKAFLGILPLFLWCVVGVCFAGMWPLPAYHRRKHLNSSPSSMHAYKPGANCAYVYLRMHCRSICIYQMAADPVSTLLPYTGDVMDRSIGNAQVPASTISFANTVGVLFTVVLYDLVLVPLTNKLKRPISMTFRIGTGFFVLILALVSAALIEMMRYRMVRSTGLVDRFLAAGSGADPLDPAFVEPMRCV